MAKVTILVAAYNAEAFLPRCLDSLLAQQLDDIQAVCIDDGSTDGTAALLRQYARRDRRIEVVTLEQNHGQAYARNQGLLQARGAYTCFLDADDWLEPDALRLAVEVFEQHPRTGCVLFDLCYDDDSHSKHFDMPAFDELDGETAFRLSLDWQIHGVYMVRTDLHRRIPYDDSCRSYSDDNTTRLHYLASDAVRHCRGVYHYWQHDASVTHQVSVRRFDYLRATESMKRQLHTINADDATMALWETIRLRVLVDCYMFYHCHGRELTPAERHYGLSEMRRTWQALDRAIISPALARKFGYRPTCCWWMFRCEEWLYFTLRAILRKNK